MKKILFYLCLLALILNASSVLSETKIVMPNYEKKDILIDYSGEILSAVFSPDGKTMVIGTSEQKLFIWDTVKWKVIKSVKENDESVTALAFTPDGKLLASGDRRNRVYIFDTTTLHLLQVFSRTSKNIIVLWGRSQNHYFSKWQYFEF